METDASDAAPLSLINQLGPILVSAEDDQLKAIGESLESGRTQASNLQDADQAIFVPLLRQVCKGVSGRGCTAATIGLLSDVTQAFGVAARDIELHDILRSANVIDFVFDIFGRLVPYSQSTECGGKSPWLRLRFESWRLVANMCADDDVSREIISSNNVWLSALISAFEDDYRSILSFPEELDETRMRCIDAPSQALYNLIGYDPARARCWDAGGRGIMSILNDILEIYWTTARTNPESDEIRLPVMVWDLIEESTGELDIDSHLNVLPTTLATNIVVAILFEDDANDKEAILMLISSLVRVEHFSAKVASDWWPLWCLICLYYNLQGEAWIRPSASNIIDFSIFKPLENVPTKSDERAQILCSIADVVEQGKFKEMTLEDDDLQSLVECLRWPESGHSQKNEEFIECVCMVLGNYAQSDQASRRVLSESNLAARLADVLEYAEQYSTRTMATRLLKNIAIPIENKDVLGLNGRIFQLLSLGLRESVRADLLQATISTGRVLISAANAKHVLPTSVLSMGESTNPSGFLECMLAVVAQIDDQSIKVEAGRFLKRMLSCLYAECDASDTEVLEVELSKVSTDLLAGPLAALVLQQQNAIVRSEGWLALALLAKSADGAVKAGAIISQPPVLQSLKDALLLQDHPQTDPAETRADQNTVTATTQQRDHDKANIQLLLRALSQRRVEIKADGQTIDVEQFLQ